MAEELRGPRGGEDFIELETSFIGSDIGLEHVNRLAEKVFETTTDRILFPVFARIGSFGTDVYSDSAYDSENHLAPLTPSQKMELNQTPQILRSFQFLK